MTSKYLQTRRAIYLFMFLQCACQYRVIEAVDGRSLTEEDLKCYSKELALRSLGRELNPGEIGAGLSHAQMWELLVNEHHQEVLILEDDVRIGRSLFAILEHKQKLPEGYEHINFSTDAAQLPFGDFITDIYRASRYKEEAWLASAYLLTAKGARKLLNLVYPLYMPIDDFVSLTDLISYGIYPKVVIPAEFASSIGRRTRLPEPGFMLRKFWEFKNILKSIAIFLGFTPQFLVKVHLQINQAIGRLHRC